MASDLIAVNKEISEIKDTVDDLLKALPDKLPKLVAIYTNQEALEKVMTPLNAQLVKIVPKPSINPFNTLGIAKNGIEASLKKIEAAISMLSEDAAATNTPLIDMRMTIDKNLKDNAVKAIKMLDGTDKKYANLKTVLTLAKALFELSKSESLKSGLASLDESQKKMETYNELVRDGLTGDFGNFVNDFVPLFAGKPHPRTDDDVSDDSGRL